MCDGPGIVVRFLWSAVWRGSGAATRRRGVRGGSGVGVEVGGGFDVRPGAAKRARTGGNLIARVAAPGGAFLRRFTAGGDQFVVVVAALLLERYVDDAVVKCRECGGGLC